MDDRTKRLGASDMAAVMGVSPYQSPVDVWLEKTGRSPPQVRPDSQKKKLDWGVRLEGLVLDRLVEETGIALHRNRLPDGSQEIIRHPKHAWLAGSPDAWSDDRIGEAKTAGWRVADRWGEPGSDEVPDEYLIQVTTYMELRRVKRAEVGVLFDGHDFRVYRSTYDAELAGLILERGERFWVDHVLADKPPEPQSPGELMALTKALHPRDSGPLLNSTPEIDALVEHLHLVRLSAELAAEKESEAKAQLQALIGDASGVHGEWGRITWKRTKDSISTDWEALGKAMLKDKDPIACANLCAEFTTTKPGHRRFLYTPTKRK